MFCVATNNHLTSQNCFRFMMIIRVHISSLHIWQYKAIAKAHSSYMNRILELNFRSIQLKYLTSNELVEYKN